MTRTAALAILVLAASVTALRADDWPQWMGPNRDGVWAETGVVGTLPKAGPKRLWRANIAAGYSGPAVAGGRLFVTDRVLARGAKNPEDPFDTKQKVDSTERVLCFDAATGAELWKHEYPCVYHISYPAGPRTTPTVHDGRVYALGAMGDLLCLSADAGRVLWAKNFPKDYAAKVQTWGFCGHPLVYKGLLICNVGGETATVVAFDAVTGAEKWKALSARDAGYAPPTLIRAGGVDQVVIWDGHAITGLDPLTGTTHWSVPLEPMYAMSIMAPRQAGDRLFAAGIGGAGVVLKLDPKKPAVSVLWQEGAEKDPTRPKARGVYPVNMTPFVEPAAGGAPAVVYGVDQPGMLRAAELDTGTKLWFSHKPVIGRAEAEDSKASVSGTAFLVKNGDRFFIFAETGELVVAKLSPAGYDELGRAKLIEPTGAAFGRKVVWSHPAFANKCVFVRNDKELACFSLAE